MVMSTESYQACRYVMKASCGADTFAIRIEIYIMPGQIPTSIRNALTGLISSSIIASCRNITLN